MADNAAPGSAPIVAAVDGSEISYQAVAWAAVEAELCSSPLHLITAFVVPGFGDPLTAARADELAELRVIGERVLGKAVQIAEHATPGGTVAITTEFSLDSIIPTLVDRSERARMIVVGNRGRGTVHRMLLGSVSTALAQHAHCPVAVVRGRSETDPDSVTKPVVVGVDGSPNSMRALSMAFEEAARRKVRLIAVHAWSDTTGFDLPVRGWESIRVSEELSLAESMAGFGERYPEVEVERIVHCDSPIRVLLQHAKDAQLLVVGSHGRGEFAAVALGSVSTALLHHAECPVLVVREG